MWMLATQCDVGDMTDHQPTVEADDLNACGVVGCVIARSDRFFDLLARLEHEDDEELVHDIRVASRRLNEGLAVIKPMLEPEELNPQTSWLKEVRGALGPVRDADVMGRTLVGVLGKKGDDEVELPPAAQGFLDSLQTRRKEALAEARRQFTVARVLVRRDDLARLLCLLVETVRSITKDEGIFNHEVQSELEQRLLRRVRRNRKTFRKQTKKASKSRKVPHLHEARIAGKKTRYALELAHDAEILEAKRELKWMRRVQNRLGDINDLSVLSERIEAHLVDTDGQEDGKDLLKAVSDHQGRLVKQFAKEASKTLQRLKRVKAKRPNGK